MSPQIIYLGLDGHKDSITLAVLPADAPTPTRVDRLPNELPKLKRYLARLAAEGTLLICYEASGAGFVLHRTLRGWGYHCDVIAPSLIPTKPGVQRKHDRYDATQLARLYRAGELTAVRVPSEAEERIRDLVRCRETLQRELLRSRHYLLKFLARRGLVFRAGKHWTQTHLTWLRALAGPVSPLEAEDVEVLNEYLALFDYKLARRQAEGRLATTPGGLREHFEGRARCRVVGEVGTHSPWVSRLLTSWGHEVLVANARQVRLIDAGDRKSDRIDAETLARLGRLDPRLLRPIQHRGAEAQAALAQLRARDALVRIRTVLINHVRGAVKSTGQRLPASSAPAFARTVAPHLEAAMQPALAPLLTMIATLSDQIRGLEHQLEALAVTRYPETARLRQVGGVGLLIALAFVLTVEDPSRFAKSREVGPYLGLCPRQASSGRYQPELRMSKRGDALLRRRLVNGAQYIVGPFGPDCTLRRKGLALAARGGKHAKKRAVIATARRLAVLLHRLWVSGAAYEPERQAA